MRKIKWHEVSGCVAKLAVIDGMAKLVLQKKGRTVFQTWFDVGSGVINKSYEAAIKQEYGQKAAA